MYICFEALSLFIKKGRVREINTPNCMCEAFLKPSSGSVTVPVRGRRKQEREESDHVDRGDFSLNGCQINVTRAMVSSRPNRAFDTQYSPTEGLRALSF